MIIALAGNPNSGKTTLFNLLTGSTAHVGNWPGVTVEKREGIYKEKEKQSGKQSVSENKNLASELKNSVGESENSVGESKHSVCNAKHSIVDLPGIYSLVPYTPEEQAARRFLIEDKPDVVINIVDATNLERNLYLTTQILELGVPTVIALNMMDSVKKAGGEIDTDKISEALGVPVLPISALKNTGIKELMAAAIAACNTKAERFDQITLLRTELKKQAVSEPDDEIDEEELEADARYRYITENISAYMKKPQHSYGNSEKADKVLTHKIFGIPIFFAIIFSVFHFTFSENFLFLGAFGWHIPAPGVLLQSGLGFLMDGFIGLVDGWLKSAPAWASGLIVDGILGGVSAVLSFLPQILLLFLFLSILEYSGYMSRVAFIMDRAFRRLGLSGKAFMPLLMCFGCAVPGIMATRTLGNERERKMSILLAPFFSCGAKLPIWATVCAAVFTKNADIAVFGIYVVGIVSAILAAFVLSKTFLKGETPPFIMELPAYRFPHPKNVWLQLWQKLKHYIVRAATLIAGAMVVIWFLSSFTFTFRMTEYASADSMLGMIGRGLKYLFIPLGFAGGNDGWKFVVAIFTGLVAKEMVIATLGALSGLEGALELGTDEIAKSSLGSLLGSLSGPAAFAFMAFNLLSVPCMAAVAAAHAEFKKKRFTFFAIAFWIVTAYLVSLAIYWTGTAFVSQNAVGIIIAVLAVTLVIFTIVFNILKRKKAKTNGGCGGNCSGCNGCG